MYTLLELHLSPLNMRPQLPLLTTLSFCSQSQKSWIESTFTKRECVYILPVSKDPHRYVLRPTVVSLLVIAMETA